MHLLALNLRPIIVERALPWISALYTLQFWLGKSCKAWLFTIRALKTLWHRCSSSHFIMIGGRLAPWSMGNAFIAHSQDSQDSSQSSSVFVESRNLYIHYTESTKSVSLSNTHQYAIISISGTGSTDNGMAALGAVANGSSVTITGYYLREPSIICTVSYSGRTVSFTNINCDGGALSVSVLGIG